MGTKAKEEGNKCYGSRSFDKAVAYYKTGLAKVRSARNRKVPGSADAEAAGPAGVAAKALEGQLHMNVAMCLVKQQAWEEAIGACGSCLRLDPTR